MAAGAAVVLLLVAGAALVLTREESRPPAPPPPRRCNGDEALCALPLDLVMLPATHNSMASAQYLGWRSAQHQLTIGGQLERGIRGLLIDTHYGPGREIYLCHNACDTGAVRFSDALGELRAFLDSHPDEVVVVIIQDATTPADTAAAIERAGLGRRARTLDPDERLPTLGDMVGSGRTLLVFAQRGGPGAPPWYHRAYDRWFQETPFSFFTEQGMSCGPNRGPRTAPLFLVNHWVTGLRPDPERAESVNRRALLAERLRRCSLERGLMPNLVAVDFAERGDVVATVREVNRALLEDVRRARRGGR